MLECFKDYVFPFYGCNSPSGTPLSNLYLTNLPGIQFKTLNEIANDDQQNWSGVWNDIQTRATIRFADDINEEFAKRYLLKQILQTVDLGVNYDTEILTPNINGTQYGIAIEAYQAGDIFGGSSLYNIYVQCSQFYYYDPVNTNSTLTLSVYDADLGTSLYTQTITQATGLKQGWNQLQVEKKFYARRIMMFYGGTFTEYVNMDITNFLLNNFGQYCGNCGGNGWGWGMGDWLLFTWGQGGCQARLNGVTVPNADYTNQAPNFGYNTFGTSVVFSLKCGFDSIACANKMHFASAWLYCLGLEFMDDLLYSSRLNRWTTIDKEKYEVLRKEFETTYLGGDMISDKAAMQYGIKVLKSKPGKLKQAIGGLVLNQYDCCLQCNNHLMASESRL